MPQDIYELQERHKKEESEWKKQGYDDHDIGVLVRRHIDEMQELLRERKDII